MITPPYTIKMIQEVRMAVKQHYHCGICPQRTLCLYGSGQTPACDFYDCDADTFATGYLAALITQANKETPCQKSRKTYFRR